jgi:hypothetical protein
MTTVDASLTHDVPDWPTAELGWRQPIYLGESVPGTFCPSDQDVSRSIAQHGCWEAFGTLLAAQLLRWVPSTVVDVGANVGWYSNLAGSFGHDVLAIDCHGWIGPESPQVDPHPIRLLKIDIEGAEQWALGVFARSLGAGLVDFVLAEVSPVMGEVGWVEDLIGIGYRAYRLPEKGYDVRAFEADPLAATIDWGPLAMHDITHQADVLFVREGLS